MTNDNLTRRHFPLNDRRVIWIIISSVQQHRWRCTSSWMRLEEIKYRNLVRKGHLLLLQNLLTASKQPHNSLSSCFCSLPVPVNVLKHPDASFNEFKPLSRLQNRHGPLLRLRLRFMSLKGAFLANLKNNVQWEPLIMAVQQLEDIFSDLRLIYCMWGAKDVCAERPKSRRRKSEGLLYLYAIKLLWDNYSGFVILLFHTHTHRI